MTEGPLLFRVRLEEEAAADVVFAVKRGVLSEGEVVDGQRLVEAARWALDLDAQCRDLIRTGRSPRVDVPGGNVRFTGRVEHQTVAGYRKLRLRVGALVRPLFLRPPRLGSLYPFQRQGVEWLIARNGAILADDMGLGKTVQVISALRILFNRGVIRTAIVVCPKSLIATWEREFVRWAPELGIAVVVPPARIRDAAWEAVLGRWHVLLTNYEQVRKPAVALKCATPDVIVADEAHRLRNRRSLLATGSLELRPARFWALTGTPLERDREDFATLLSVVLPSRFVPDDAKLHPSILRSRARPHVLRRRKEQVLSELPPVLDTTDALDLTEAQRRAYGDTVKEHRQRKGVGDELALLTRLQMLCDIEPTSGQSSKVDRIVETLSRIRNDDEKAVVFSYRLEPLRALERRITKRWGRKASALLIGDMGGEERERAVKYFREDDTVVALLASSRVGGEGLTLTEANHVFLFNQWWNPSANDQARDRVVRIGQRRTVRVYRYCCRATIEEALERILESKRLLFQDAVERLTQGDRTAWRRVVDEVGIEELVDRTGE